MLLVSVSAQFSEQNIQMALKILQTLEQRTRNTIGRQKYKIYIDPTNPTSVFLFQIWTSQSNFDAYKNGSDFAKMGEELAPLMTSSPKTDMFEAEQIS